MGIRKIKLTNFKSFDKLEVKLNNFNVLIGANASGKSNFIHIFEFLRDIVRHDLDNAISMQGDIEYFRNINIGSDEDFSLEILSDKIRSGFSMRKEKEKSGMKIQAHEMLYKFAIKFYKRQVGFRIAKDELRLKIELLRLKEQKKEVEEKLGEGKITFVNKKGKLRCNVELPDNVPIKKEDLMPFRVPKEKLFSKKTLLLETPFMHFPYNLSSRFEDISIYDFSPKVLKKLASISGKTELEDDGSNLAIILKNILDKDNKRRKFLNLTRDVLSFVEGMGVEKFAGRSLLVKLREAYSKKTFLPALSASDGTMNIIALIVALYFERTPLIILEEPGRNIHPALISRLVTMMKEVSEKTQIIVTTHNPEIVKYAKLEDILLISRDKKGFSQIYRPCDKKEVRTFLANDMGIEELYVQNLL